MYKRCRQKFKAITILGIVSFFLLCPGYRVIDTILTSLGPRFIGPPALSTPGGLFYFVYPLA